MKPVTEALRIFMFEPVDERTRQYIESFLQHQYPEATWTVELTDDLTFRANVSFKSTEEETFYRLKWA